MIKAGNWVDAHGHLADERWQALGPAHMDQVISEARSLGIHFFMQAGVGPDDWQRQRDLKSRYPQSIGLCFGVHPYWVASHDEDDCEQALDILAPQLVDSMGIGEMGLDFRPHIMKDSQSRQLSVFESQLELAHATQKPMVLHIVQAHNEALRFFDIWGMPAQKGMVHSFNGSSHKALELVKRGLLLSIGGPVCRPDNVKLHQAVKEIPLEMLLIESDSPDQAPPRFENQLNPPASIWDVARTIATIKSLDPVEILDISSANFRRLFQWT